MRFLTAATLIAGFAGRPQASATVDIAASADKDEQPLTIQAMAVKGFAATAGKLQWIKAKEHFYAGLDNPVYVDDYAQVTEEDAKRLVNAGRAALATDDEVAAAQKAAKK